MPSESEVDLLDRLGLLSWYLNTQLLLHRYRVKLTFQQIEGLVQDKLPEPAFTNYTWWDELARANGYRSVVGNWTITASFSQQTVEFYNAGAAMRRSDLADKYAIIAVLPRTKFDGKGDISGGIDFREVEADIEAFQEEVRQIIVAEFGTLFEPSGTIAFEESRYEIGPAASSWPMFLFVLPDPTTITAWVAVATAVATAAKSIITSYNERMAKRAIGQEKLSQLTFTKPILVALCESHIRQTFHPRARIMSDVEAFPGNMNVTDENHPGFDEQYRVRCRVGRKTYVFDIDGHATVSAFSLKEGARTLNLPQPNFASIVPG